MVSTNTPSRRGLLRLAGAGTLAALVMSRPSPAVRAQEPYPTRVRVLHASPALGKIEVHINGQEALDAFT
jgi:hypothetical protein